MKNILNIKQDILDVAISDFDMDLSNGLYLEHEIVAFSGDWLIVWDGKYNYYLFNVLVNTNIHDYKRNQMPNNRIGSADGSSGCYKCTEYYTVFDTAVKNLCKVIANGGFFVFRSVL